MFSSRQRCKSRRYQAALAVGAFWFGADVTQGRLTQATRDAQLKHPDQHIVRRRQEVRVDDAFQWQNDTTDTNYKQEEQTDTLRHSPVLSDGLGGDSSSYVEAWPRYGSSRTCNIFRIRSE